MLTAVVKSPLFLGPAALIAPGVAGAATMSLQFSQISSNIATNWANGAGEAGKNMAWGIVVDRNGDGLAGSFAVTGVNYGIGTTTGQSLLDASGTATDDMLFMSPISMVTLAANFNGNDGAVSGQNFISAIVTVPFLAGVNTGDSFHLIWFDTDFGSSAATVYGAPQVGESYGIFSDASFIVPGEGHTTSYSAVFDGVDPLKPMTNTWSSGLAAAPTPEPSSMLLGLLGALDLLRRRR